MHSPIAQIKEKLSIEEVVSSYIKLENAGGNLKARCPFHNEKTPSFFVSTSRNSYYCFGCGAKGDIFTFVQEFEGLDFKGALKILAGKAGIPLESFKDSLGDQKEILYKIMEEATLFFVQNLNKNTSAIEYLKGRGLTLNTISDFRIGFAPDSWRDLYFYLKNKGYKEEDIEKAGLIKKTEKGFYDRFRSRIIFPLFDSSSRVIAFSGRIFENSLEKKEFTQAKYLNSPETPIFNKSMVLYGIHKAKEAIRKLNFAILVEGQMDLVLSHQAGFRNTIATSGTALSEEIKKEEVIGNFGLIRRITPNILLAFDGDNAGFNATLKASKISLSLGMDTKVISLEKDMDPADFILKNGNDAWKEKIKNSKHIIEILLEKAKEEAKEERFVLKNIKDKVLPFVALLQSKMDQSFFLKKISDNTGVPLFSIEEDFKKVEIEGLRGQREDEKEGILEKLLRKDFILRRLLGLILWQEGISGSKIDVSFLKEEISRILELDFDLILNKRENEKEEWIYEAEIFYQNNFDLEKEILFLLNNLKEETLKEKLRIKLEELRLSEEKNDKEKSKEILKEYQNISSQIESLKKTI